MLTGHVLVSLLASAVFLSYEIALRGGIYLYHSYFHYTFDGKNSERITDVLFSPMVMIFNYIYKSRKNVPMAFMETGTGEQEKILLWLAFLTVIFGILSFILYLRRASESYGKSISFSFVKEPVKAAILFLAGIYGGLFFYSASGSAVAFGVVGIIFIILLGHAVIQMIYEADLKAVRKKLLLPFGVIAVTVTFFIVYKYDLTEYDMRYPKESKVEAVGIDLMTENRYDQFWLLEDGIELWNNEYAQNMMRITNLQPVYQLLSNMENLKEIKKNNEANKNNGVEEGNYYHVDIKFYLKNNKVEYRRYYFDYVKNIELLNEIYHMEEYKKVTEQILEEDFIEKNNIFQAVYGNGLKETPLEKKEKISKLLEAYKKDMEEVHYRNIFSEMPVGSIRFEGRGILSEEFTNYWQKPVYPSFKNTISFFEGEGIHWKAGQDVEEILESVADVTVAVTDYDKWRMASYVNKDKYTKEIVYKEKEKIKEILEIGIPRLCRDWTNAPVEIEEQYTIEVRRKITPEEKRIITGEPDYVTGDIDYLEEIIIYSYIFKKGEVPEFIEKDFS